MFFKISTCRDTGAICGPGMSKFKTAKEFTKFCSVGLICTAIQYLLLVLLIEIISLQEVIASAAAYGCSAIVNYLLNYHLTFQVTVRHQTAGVKFAVMVLLGLFSNTLLFYIAFSHFNLPYIYAQIIATGLVLMQNFTLSKTWAFKK